jgi:hypothetical protein
VHEATKNEVMAVVTQTTSEVMTVTRSRSWRPGKRGASPLFQTKGRVSLLDQAQMMTVPRLAPFGLCLLYLPLSAYQGIYAVIYEETCGWICGRLDDGPLGWKKVLIGLERVRWLFAGKVLAEAQRASARLAMIVFRPRILYAQPTIQQVSVLTRTATKRGI